MFITVNPGDGKTHLLMRLENDLHAAGVEIHRDANEENDTELIEYLDSAERKRRAASL
jgi:hypothetical protein